MSFRIGRKLASHTYPESRALTTVPTAGNFARGPAQDTPIDAAPGTQVPWALFATGAPPGVDIAITPRSSGNIRIVGAFTVQNLGEGAEDFSLNAQIGGVTLAPTVQATVEASGFVTVPYVLDVILPIGVTSNIEMLFTAVDPNVLNLIAGSSTVDVQEIPKATG